MLKIYPSEEGFEELYQLANDIAMLTNPQLFYDMKDLPMVEKSADLEQTKEKMGEIIS